MLRPEFVLNICAQRRSWCKATYSHLTAKLTGGRKYGNVSPSTIHYLHIFHDRYLHLVDLSTSNPPTLTHTHPAYLTPPLFTSLLLIAKVLQ